MIKCTSCGWDKSNDDLRRGICSECRMTNDRLIIHHIRDLENGIELGKLLAETEFAVQLQINAWQIEIESLRAKLSDA